MHPQLDRQSSQSRCQAAAPPLGLAKARPDPARALWLRVETSTRCRTPRASSTAAESLSREMNRAQGSGDETQGLKERRPALQSRHGRKRREEQRSSKLSAKYIIDLQGVPGTALQITEVPCCKLRQLRDGRARTTPAPSSCHPQAASPSPSSPSSAPVCITHVQRVLAPTGGELSPSRDGVSGEEQLGERLLCWEQELS